MHRISINIYIYIYTRLYTNLHIGCAENWVSPQMAMLMGTTAIIVHWILGVIALCSDIHIYIYIYIHTCIICIHYQGTIAPKTHHDTVFEAYNGPGSQLSQSRRDVSSEYEQRAPQKERFFNKASINHWIMLTLLEIVLTIGLYLHCGYFNHWIFLTIGL